MNLIPRLNILDAYPETSPVIPPPSDIKQSFRLKLFFNNFFKILSTLAWFLFNSLALNEWTITLFLGRDFKVLLTIFFGILLSIIIRHLLKLIELSLSNLKVKKLIQNQ